MRAIRPTIDPAVPAQDRALLEERGTDLPSRDETPKPPPRRRPWTLTPSGCRAAQGLRRAGAHAMLVAAIGVVVHNAEFTLTLLPPDPTALWTYEVDTNGIPVGLEMELGPWMKQMAVWTVTTLPGALLLLSAGTKTVWHLPILLTGLRRKNTDTARAIHTHHGQYVLPGEVGEDDQPVLARAQNATDLVASSPLPGLEQARLVLEDLEWSVASQLRDQETQRRLVAEQGLTDQQIEAAHTQLDQAREHTLALAERMDEYAHRVEATAEDQDLELEQWSIAGQGEEERRALVADASVNELRGAALEDLPGSESTTLSNRD